MNECFVCGWWLRPCFSNQHNTEATTLGISPPRRIDEVFGRIKAFIQIYDGGFGFTACSNDMGHVTLLGCGETKEVADALVCCGGRVALGFDTIVTVQGDTGPRLDVFRYSHGSMSPWFSRGIVETAAVTRVAAGMKHALVLTEDGAVHQIDTLCKGSLQSINVPCRVTLIACGSDHSAVVDQHGHTYTWGSNLRGQCGRGYNSGNNDNVLIPGEILHAVEVTSISCGLSFTVCCSRLGDVYSFGTSQDGAHGHDTPTLYEPTLVEFFGTEKDTMAVQVCSGSSHTLVRTESGAVFGFGSNEFGQTGTQESTTHVPHRVRCDPEHLPCVDIKAGWWHSVFTYAK